MRRLATLATMAFLVVSLTGCSMVAAHFATEFSLIIETPEVTIAAGDSAPVGIRIDRIIPVDALPVGVTVDLHNPPDGVSAETLHIPSGIDEDDLIVRVADGTRVTGPTGVTIRATNGFKTKEATFELTIGTN